MILQRTLVAATVLLGCVYSTRASAAVPVRLEYKVVKSFSTLYDRTGSDSLSWGINSPDGIAWNGTGLWMTACGDSRLGELDANGTLLDQIKLPDVSGSDHVAWDGQFLWAVVHSMPNSTGPLVSKLIQIDTAGPSIIKTIQLPWGDRSVMAPMGLAWDGQNLWTNNPGAGQIYRVNAKTGAGKDQPIYPVPSFNGQQLTPCGISWDEYSCLWISDLNMPVDGSRGGYFQVAPTTGEIVSYLVPPDNPDPAKYGQYRPPSVTRLFTGMTTDGERVWVVDEVEGNPLIYQLDVAFPKTGPCAHPVAVGDPCVPGGEPFCGKGAMCYGEPSAEVCHVACDIAHPVCPDQLTCQTKPGVGDLCLVDPGPPPSSGSAPPADSGCSCSAVGTTGGAPAGGPLLLAGLLLPLRRRRRRHA